MPSPDPSGAPVRTARTRRAAGPAEPRWAALWREIERARERLAEHERRADGVETLFRTRIEPRERLLTLGALRVTEALVDRYEGEGLERADRSLLGLWVNENLESLADHPYAPAEPVAALAARWRALLGAAGEAPPDPSDPTSATYRTMPVARGADEAERLERDAISRYLGALFERGAGARLTPGPGPHDRDGRDGPGSADGERDDASNADRDGGSGAAGGPPSGGGPAPDGDAPGAPPPGAAVPGAHDPDGARAVIETLFRRLARALHPDREPDGARREIKHVLMSTALAARRARDVDTLLALHVEHVGALPDAHDGAGADALARALERRLAALRRALDRARHGDPFRAGLLSRYDGADAAARARRVAAHAERLDAETERLARLADRLATAAGLEDALDDRREIERDRLAIDELTGG